MKKIVKTSTLLLLLVFIVTSCKKDDNSSSSSSASSVTIQVGKWQVTSYVNNGIDETHHFTGYEFQFNQEGTAIATKNNVSASGTWSYGSDNSNPKFNLKFSSSPLYELNSDWHILVQTTTQLKLENVSGGGGGTDYLTFTKI